MAEEIAFQQPGGHRGTVHLDHSARVAAAEIMNGAGNQLFAGAGFAEDQHGAVALRHHFDLLEYAVHRFAAADDFAKLALDIIQLFGERQIFIHQPLLKPLNFAIGEGIIDGDRHPFGNLSQQLEVGGGEHLLIALRQFQHAQQRIARHQRQQAQRLNLVAPHLKKHFLVRGQRVVLV